MQLNLQPDRTGQILGTPFDRFHHKSGVSGLAWVDGESLHILAIVASKPKSGQMTSFLDEAEIAFGAVMVWEMMNPALETILARRGYYPWQQMVGGDWCQGMRRDRPVSKTVSTLDISAL